MQKNRYFKYNVLQCYSSNIWVETVINYIPLVSFVLVSLEVALETIFAVIFANFANFQETIQKYSIYSWISNLFFNSSIVCYKFIIVDIIDAKKREQEI